MIFVNEGSLESWVWVLIIVGAVVLTAVVTIIIYSFVPKFKANRAQLSADKIINDANVKAEKILKNAKIDAKQTVFELKQEADKDIKERKQEVIKQEDKLLQREKSIDARDQALLKKEQMIENKERNLDNQIEENKKKADVLNQKINSILVELENIGKLTEKDAREEIFRRVEEKEQLNIAKYMKEKEEEAESKAEEMSKEILSLAIARNAQEVTTERTITTISLPNAFNSALLLSGISF